MWYNVIQCDTMWYNVIQCDTMWYNVIWYHVILCDMMWYNVIWQGWPDFFSRWPFSIICTVLGAASSFQEVEGFKNFENFSADLWKSQEVPKMFFKNVIFWNKKVKKGILGGAFFKKNWAPHNSRATKNVWRAACGPRAALWPCLLYDVIWCDMIWYVVIQCEMVWYNTIWFDLIWCYMLQ